jgi:hypothetical protein
MHTLLDLRHPEGRPELGVAAKVGLVGWHVWAKHAADLGPAGRTRRIFTNGPEPTTHSTLLLFTAPVCKTCRAVEEAWGALGEHYAESSTLLIAYVNATTAWRKTTDAQSMMKQFGVSTYPAIRYWNPPMQRERYERGTFMVDGQPEEQLHLVGGECGARLEPACFAAWRATYAVRVRKIDLQAAQDLRGQPQNQDSARVRRVAPPALRAEDVVRARGF